MPKSPISFVPLLSRAVSRCGRALFCLLLPLPFVLASCSKEVQRYEAMVHYHAESQQLPQVSVDSVQRFSSKVDAFVALHPAAAEDPLYPAILQNIGQALQCFTITADTTWAGIYRHGTF